MSWAALLLAAALLLGVDRPRVRACALADEIRAGLQVTTPVRAGPARSADPLAVASTLDVLAACLRSGMAVATAATSAAPSAPPRLGRLLSRAADMLALGADPSTAWSNPVLPVDNHTEALLRLARRSAASGTALAEGVAELAAQSRHDAADAADATAQRASVLIAGPLGLCYLPAFLCLGIVPVVAGLATDVLQSGIL